MVTIERASPEDAPALAQVGTQAFAQDAERYGASPSGIDRVENHLAWLEQCHYYKILDAAAIVGGILVSPSADGHYGLSALFVAPAFQRQGIGTRAVRLMEQTYPAATRWALCTPYLNHRLHRFYERVGYVKVGETNPGDHPEVPDPRFHLFIYGKSMVPPCQGASEQECAP